jgi:hypothetical protein
MERNGEGIHHVGYRVASTADVLEHVKAEGARVVDEHPRTLPQREPATAP